MNAQTQTTQANIIQFPSTINIAHNLILTRLKIKAKTFTKKAKEIEHDTQIKYGNKKGTSSSSKKLLEDCQEWQKLSKFIGQTRIFFRQQTLLWDEEGGRRAQTKANYFDFIASMTAKQSEFWMLYADFENIYPYAVQEDKKALAKLFNPADYPSVYNLREHFGFKVEFEEVPTGAELKFGLDKDYISGEINKLVAERVQGAQRDIYEKIQETVGALVEKIKASLEAVKATGQDNTRWYPSLTENLEDMADLVPKLNFMNDNTLNKIANDIKGLVKYNAQQIKNNEGLKRDVLVEAQNILDTIDNFI